MMDAKHAVNDVHKGLAFRDHLDEGSTDMRDEGGAYKKVAAWGGWDEARLAIQKARLAVEGSNLHGRKSTERKGEERASPLERGAYEEGERAELESTPTHEDTPSSSTGNDEGHVWAIKDSLLSRPSYSSPVIHPDPPSDSHAIPTNILEREASLPTISLGSPSTRDENENDAKMKVQAWDGWAEATAALEKAKAALKGKDSQLKGEESQLKGENSGLVRSETPELRDPHARTQTGGGSLEKERAYWRSMLEKQESLRGQSKRDQISKEEGEVLDKRGLPSGRIAKEEEIAKVAGPPQDLLGDVMAKQGVPADPKLEEAPEEEEESWYEMVSEFLADATLHKPARADERKEVVQQPTKSVWQWMDEAGLWCTWGALVGYRDH
mmetsp:Transcript_33740/g.56666  ORF Transcript_33740/g.56666 Transcript_33740/m.56666 type:complete len:382 (-) Transcript_33740:361-1506(-)|eukprot:CAMPEP_0198214322 /NCGR_PEP_ID=MMETSP1445-20131203/40478_1 /TAXON_ID=36898 /ORGANISM="Pyramimonas sp., Strain CCMP2087" /LENGTH=381 /DNA_ID=CAMNT_0043889459 /DNA_START=183 /DNA_END=1328 /DNA_ORIENTATION=+